MVKTKDTEKKPPKTEKYKINEIFAGLGTGVTGDFSEHMTSVFGEGWHTGATREQVDVDESYQERVSRTRKACRDAYIAPNAVFEAGVKAKISYVVGDQFSIGATDDETANEVIREFIAINDFERLVEQRIFLEMLIDGEISILFDKEASAGEVPKVGICNADRINRVEGNQIDGVKKLVLRKSSGAEEEYDQTEFVFWANKANFGELRGYPYLEGARRAAEAIIDFIDGRVRVNELQSRINLIFKHLIWDEDEDLTVEEQMSRCERKNFKVPKDGAVLHSYVDAKTGNSESVEFITTDKSASDASSDYEILRKTFAFAMSLADYMIGWGNDVNRATAQVISEAVVKVFQSEQKMLKSVVLSALRLALKRVNGPEATYKIMVKDGETETQIEVAADELEIPINLPNLQTDSLEEKITMLEFADKLGHSKEEALRLLGLQVIPT